MATTRRLLARTLSSSALRRSSFSSAAVARPLPDATLLSRYRATPQQPGGYVDCFTCSVPRAVSLADYVFAFYTTPVFRLERWVLAALAATPSTDDEARGVADGTRSAFSAWRVESRAADELLMCDVRAHTRSWFMVTSEHDGATRLWFGSAVVPLAVDAAGAPTLARAYRWLLPAHRTYSRVLLGAAARCVSP